MTRMSLGGDHEIIGRKSESLREKSPQNRKVIRKKTSLERTKFIINYNQLYSCFYILVLLVLKKAVVQVLGLKECRRGMSFINFACYRKLYFVNDYILHFVFNTLFILCII